MRRIVTAEELQRVGEARIMHRLERRDAFVSLAILTYGPRWQLPLSEPLGVSQAMLSLIALCKRDISDDLFGELVAHSRQVGKTLVDRAAAIEVESEAIVERIRTGDPKPQLVGTPAPDPEPEPEPDLDDDGPDMAP